MVGIHANLVDKQNPALLRFFLPNVRLAEVKERGLSCALERFARTLELVTLVADHEEEKTFREQHHVDL